MKKIILLGLQTDPNLGDRVISECSRRLVADECAALGIETVIEAVDIRGVDYREKLARDAEQRRADAARREREAEERRNRQPTEKQLRRAAIKTAIGRCLPFAVKIYDDRAERKKAAREAEKKRLAEEARERRKAEALKAEIDAAAESARRCVTPETGAVIFAGGGLIKPGHQHLSLLIEPYLRRADELGVPVMLRAVGVEGYDENNAECQLLVELLNLDCVRCVTTRDDIALLREKYVRRPGIATALVADPACVCPELYPSERRRSDIIGVGTVRGKLFADHGVDLAAEQLLELWAGVLTELDRRGHEWRLFSNGLPSDSEFGRELLARVGCPEDDGRLLPPPETPEQLVGLINGFGAVLACRLHTAIIADAYGVPTVELVWNVKQRHYGLTVGSPERFIEREDFCPETIVERLESVMRDPPAVDTAALLKANRAALRGFLERI